MVLIYRSLLITTYCKISIVEEKDYMIELPFDENINIRILENVFDDMTNSYKIFWFLGVFEEIINNKITMTFKEVVARMIVKAWYPLLNYNLNFGPQDQMSKNVKKYIRNISKIRIL